MCLPMMEVMQLSMSSTMSNWRAGFPEEKNQGEKAQFKL